MPEIDQAQAALIIERFRQLDPYQAHYLKYECEYERRADLVPDTGDLLRRALDGQGRVLDVGCGDGRTLLANADRFGHGTGVDVSAEHMVAAAIQARDEAGICNVLFETAWAVALPFEDQTFDFVFSERGPLGHCDETLVEALRVLRQGGRIFVETPGTFDDLVRELARFTEHGVDVRTAAARRHTLVFPDFSNLLRYWCSVWTYLERELPSPDDSTALESILADSRDAGGRLAVVEDTIWIAGAKC